MIEVTDDKSLPKAERKLKQIKHAPFISHEAKLVKLADKISSLRDIISAPPTDWSKDRKKEYFNWADQVRCELRGSNPKLEKIIDELLT